MSMKSKSKRIWNLIVFWEHKEREEINDVTWLDMQEGWYTKWRDPKTGLYCAVNGIKVVAMEQPRGKG